MIREREESRRDRSVSCSGRWVIEASFEAVEQLTFACT